MRKLVMLLVCLWVSTAFILGQKTIKGLVCDETDEPIIGASVIVTGTTIGTITGIDGDFSFSVPESAKELKVSYVGMDTQLLPITSDMHIVLKSNSQDLDEVVVVAYGTTSARNITGAISSIKGDAIRNIPGPSVDGMLQGRASGVMITTPTSSVGAAPIINIRGVSSISNSTNPLYVVDGMIFTTDASSSTRQNPLADLNSSDIKSIEILKDAAATALYGSRAANGVVLITTHSQAQGKATIAYNGSYTFSKATKMLKTLTAQEYTDFKNLTVQNTADRIGDPGFYNKYKYGMMYYTGESGVYATEEQGLGYADTNWADLLFRNGHLMNHDINVSGGTEQASYYISTGIMNQDGITVGDEFKRYSFKANTNFKFNPFLKGGFNATYSNTDQKNVDGGYGDGLYSINGFSRMAAILPSNIPAFDLDGTAHQTNQYLGKGNNSVNCSYYNPMSYIDEQESRMVNNRVIASGFLETNPIKGLSVKSQYGVDWFFTNSHSLQSPSGGDGYAAGGNAYLYNTTRKTWTWTNTAQYNFSIKDNHFAAMIGMEAQEMKYRRQYTAASTLSDPEMIYVEAPYSTYTGSGTRADRSMVSYLSRANWNYKYRYYLEASFRRDGLSSLGKKWGNFWGASASWRISDESFWEPLRPLLNDFRFKASYGIVGNTNVDTYAAISTYTSAYYNGVGSYYVNKISDPNLGWEQTAKTDIGLTGQIKNNFMFEVTYFNSSSKDLILNSSQAYSTGIPEAEIVTNLGKARNRGVEASINGTLLQKGDFVWESNLNFTYVKNKILKLESDIVENGTGAANITVEGKSMSQLYIYPTAGVDPETGRRIVLLDDENGDPTRKALLVYTNGAGVAVYDINSGDKLDINDWNPHIMGGTKPTWYGGWSNTFTWKGFDLGLFLQFSGGNKIYNGMKASMSDMRFWNNTQDVLREAWYAPGDRATFAKPEFYDNYSNGSANPIGDWVESGNYFRLKNLSLGYTFNTRSWPKVLGVSYLRLYLVATNLFCITSYSGMDPEINSRADKANLISGIDKNTTPLTKTVSLGLNIKF